MTSQTNSIPCFGTAFNTARRNSPAKKKRMAPLSVRLSKEQREQLEQDAMGMALNAFVLSKLFDNYKTTRQRKKPTKRDKAVASALRRMGNSGIAAFLTCQILAVEEGRLHLTKHEELELREAYAELYRIRCDLVQGMGLGADYKQ